MAKTHFDLCWQYHNQTIVIGPTHLHSLDDTYAHHTVRYVYHPTPMTKMIYHRAKWCNFPLSWHRYLINSDGFVTRIPPKWRQPFTRRVIHFPLSLRSFFSSYSSTLVFINKFQAFTIGLYPINSCHTYHDWE